MVDVEGREGEDEVVAAVSEAEVEEGVDGAVEEVSEGLKSSRLHKLSEISGSTQLARPSHSIARSR